MSWARGARGCAEVGPLLAGTAISELLWGAGEGAGEGEGEGEGEKEGEGELEVAG
jgi:hypothetical protein